MTSGRHPLLDQAISSVRSGDRAAAGDALRRIVAEDPSSTEAWLWLSGVEVDPAGQRNALEHVIALDPTNARARYGLGWLREHHPELWATPEPPIGDVSASQPATSQAATGTDLDPAPALSVEAHASPASLFVTPLASDEPAEPVPVTTTPPAEPDQGMDAFSSPDRSGSPGEEELRCPFCGEWAGPADARCPSCEGTLIVPAEPKTRARLARMALVLFWLLVSAAAVAGSVWVLGDAVRRGAVTGALTAWGDLLVGQGAFDPEGVVTGMGLTLGALGIVGVIMIVGLVRRWRWVYILQLLVAIAALIATASVAVMALPLLTSPEPPAVVQGTNGSVVTGLVLALVFIPLLLTIACWREFFPTRGRVRIPVAPRSASEHFRLGERYRDRGWHWVAARELEQAVEQNPNALSYRRALADVYSSMGDDVRARDELRASLNLPSDTSPIARAGTSVEGLQRER